MKRTYLSAILFIVVIMSVAAGVYVKWEKSQKQAVSQPVKSGTFSTYKSYYGEYVNPIPDLSGKTYKVTDEAYGIAMLLPVEFKESVARNTFISNSVYFGGYRNKVVYNNSDQEIKLSPTYAMSFDLIEKSEINPNDDMFKYETKIFPKLENLEIGQSHTYSKYTDQEKLKIFGEDYKNLDFLSDEIYTRLPDINEWKVYKHDNFEEYEPRYGYIATLETETYLFNVRYSTFFETLISQEIRTDIINYHKDVLYSILESTKFN